ncbi:ankyrin repeat domain-containing protein [Jiangella anatolica]|uniref:Uncharacterized protein n=1 Tax=Jiangella anatolica TaxID=2670374 RepID=A0A2W2C249_9ACTN|nr:ankyrin repeat domain-containing protein [Jiangella anatolica]PZF82007.1 hypothetical protein C1I92_18440 [Jiangella anatolica]
MPELPARPDLGHLKKQAKQLLRAFRDGDPAAAARFRATVPHATGPNSTGPQLRDAQSCVAREYGFASWAALREHVDEVRGLTMDEWLRLVYAGDTIGGTRTPRPELAVRRLADVDRAGAERAIGLATGDVAAVRAAIAADPGWVHRPGGPLGLAPLLAVTHSSLVRLPEFAPGLRESARTLLAAGADPDQSLTTPDGHLLSALYGAAGVTHDAEMTVLLLDAGADPDDESLYHSLDGDLACTRALLAAGATVTGTNAMFHVADANNADALRLLLAHGGDPNEPSPSLGTPLLFAIRRRCSAAFVRLLLDAVADPHAVTPDGVGAHRLALRLGLPEVAALLSPGDDEDDPLEDLIAACARADAGAAKALLAARPGLTSALDAGQRRLLPDLAGEGAADAVRAMVEAGWPIDTRGGDWDATALNHAVMRGDAELTRFLLEHGADPAVPHGFGDTVVGTLSWASLNDPDSRIDLVGCAQALLDHGVVPPAGYDYSDEVRAVFS